MLTCAEELNVFSKSLFYTIDYYTGVHTVCTLIPTVQLKYKVKYACVQYVCKTCPEYM